MGQLRHTPAGAARRPVADGWAAHRLTVRERGMRELLRTNDPVKLSWIQALLADAWIEAVVLDTHTSIVEGSIGAIPRRLCVLAEDLERARRVLDEAGEEYSAW